MVASKYRPDSFIFSFIFVIGGIYIFFVLLKLLTSLRKLFLREGHDLKERYGIGTWAMVTGPTSATGHGLVNVLAENSFNLVLVGRDLKGIQEMRELLVSKYGVKVRTISADFAQSGDLTFYSDIFKQVEDLDISVLVHAVGMACLSKKFHLQPIERNQQCLMMNMFSPVLLSQHIIPRLEQRYHRSAIIVVTGENANQPMPGMAVSSGAKAFLRNFAVAASLEYERKIDVMSVEPLAVKKQSLDEDDRSKESIFIVESEKFARATLKQLGHERSTSGHWIHQLQSYLSFLFPEELRLQFWFKILLPQQLSSSSSEDGIDERKDAEKSEFSFTNYVTEFFEFSNKAHKN